MKVEFGPNQVVQKLLRIYEERRSPEAGGIPVPLYYITKEQSRKEKASP